MRERHKDQHLVAGLLDDFQHGVQSVADVELQDLSTIRIDRTSADLQELVDLNRCVDRADLFAICFKQHLSLKLLIVLRLLRGERRVTIHGCHGW